MIKTCDFCKKEELLPFQCPFCAKYFCVEHRLPENHECPDMPERTPLGRWQAKICISEKLSRTLSPTALRTAIYVEADCPKCSSEQTMLTAFRTEYNAFECLKCRHKWKRFKTEQPSRKKK